MDDGARLLLFDPLGVPGELEGRAGDRETLIVLTNPSHERAARSLVERLEYVLPSHGGPTDRGARAGARMSRTHSRPGHVKEARCRSSRR